MISRRMSVVERFLFALLVVTIVAMLAVAVLVGMTPPESSEPVEPYEIQHLAPVSTTNLENP